METGAAERVLSDFVAAAQSALGEDLVSVVLYGSGAERTLRPESDLNVIVVLERARAERLDALREPLRAAEAAGRLKAMLLLSAEIEGATRAFADKFQDVAHRHRVLFGPDPFASLAIPREVLAQRLRQSLLNLTLRLREAYARHGGDEREASRALADAAGPLRSAAASLAVLEGKPAPSPKKALEAVAAGLGGGFAPALATVSAAREHRDLAAGDAARALFAVGELAALLHERASRL